jgi:3-methyladenine DNA glycosylase AlkD
MSLQHLKSELRKHKDREKARLLQRFFKTGPGEYAEGDIFLGLNVPTLRTLSKRYQSLPLPETLKLLKSLIHEERLLALLILVSHYEKADPAGKEKIYKAYLAHTRYINNWDLVDLSAKRIVGAFLEDQDRTVLRSLALSDSLWERRIAVLACFHFIAQDDLTDSLKIARVLLHDPHDLIHKAVGWMLREVGKRDPAAEERFLNQHAAAMPRTMLRYAIERFPERKRRKYLRGTFALPG